MSKPADAEIISVEVDMLRIRQSIDTKPVKKCVSLPKWLKDLGEENNINFSRTLRRALKAELGVYTSFGTPVIISTSSGIK